MSDSPSPAEPEHFESHAIPMVSPRISRSVSRSQACLLLLIGFLCGCLALAATRFLVRNNKALPMVYALVEIHSERTVLPGGAAVSRDDEFDGYRRTQAALVKSRLVLDQAVNSLPPGTFDLMGVTKPAVWLEENLRVDFDLSPGTLRIGLDGGKPEELKRVVSAVVETYISRANENKYKEQLNRLEELKKLKTNCADRLDRHARELVLVQQSPDPGISEEHEDLRKILFACRQELRQVRLARRVAIVAATEAAQINLARTAAGVLMMTSPMGQGTYSAAAILASGEIGAKDNGSPITDRTLAAVEALLETDENTLMKRLKEFDINVRPRVNSTAHKADFEVSEQIYRQVSAEVAALEVEINSPTSNRIRKLGEIVVRDDN